MMKSVMYLLLLPAIAMAQNANLERWSFSSGSGSGTFQNTSLLTIAGLPGAGTAGGGNTLISWAFLADTLSRGNTVSVPGGDTYVPDRYALNQNFPNPFNPSTMISWAMPVGGLVTLKVYDVLGREVATPLEKQFYEPGSHVVPFDGSGLASGIYFYSLNTGGGGRESYSAARKMLLLK